MLPATVQNASDRTQRVFFEKMEAIADSWSAGDLATCKALANELATNPTTMKVLGSVPKSDIDKALSELRRDKNFKAIEANFLGLALILAIAIALFLYVFNSRRLEEFKKGIEDLDKD